MCVRITVELSIRASQVESTFSAGQRGSFFKFQQITVGILHSVTGATNDIDEVVLTPCCAGTLAISERDVIGECWCSDVASNVNVCCADAEMMAIDEVNAQGGVLKKKIVTVFANGASDAAVFAAEATCVSSFNRSSTVSSRSLLLANPDISFVFGCWTSASRVAVKPLFEAAQKLLFYPGSPMSEASC